MLENLAWRALYVIMYAIAAVLSVVIYVTALSAAMIVCGWFTG